MSNPVPGDLPPTVDGILPPNDSLLAGLPGTELIVSLRSDLERRWECGERLRVEAYLDKYPSLPSDTEGMLDLIYTEIVIRERCGERPGLEEYLQRFPRFAAQLKRQFEVHRILQVPTVSGLRPAETVLPPGDRQTMSGWDGSVGSWPTVPGYEILQELGRGGMGVVYRARQLRLNRVVALKVILAGGHAGQERLTRFRTEAETTARLKHPHIVQIHDVGEHDGLPYLALEYVDGVSLAEKLRENPLPPQQAAELVEMLARAIDHAHQQGVIHRDLKPANILLVGVRGQGPGAREEGVRGQGPGVRKEDSLSSLTPDPSPLTPIPKITDFGLAKQLDHESGATQSGAILGTPSYMSPEQAEGLHQKIGPATDIYALGAILYELLTGRPPFKAATPLDTVLLVATEEPVPPIRLQPGCPRDLQTICLKCLEKQAHRRYPSALALAEDLGCFVRGEPIRARPTSIWERGAKWARRRPAVAGLLAGLALVTVLGFAGVTWQWRRAENEADARQLAFQAEAEQRRETERQLYFGRILMADRELQAGRPAWAEEQLDRCPPELRQWEWRYLQAWCRGAPPSVAWQGHVRPISSVAFRPDGKEIASGGGDGKVRIRAAATGEVRHVLKAQDTGVNWVAFHPTDALLAAAGEDGTVILFNADTGAERLIFHGHRAPVSCVVFHPRAPLAVSATFDADRPGEILVWDTGSGQVRQTLQGHESRVTALAFSREGRRLASASHDRTVRLWNGETWGEERVFRQHTLPVACVTFSPDGKLLVSAGGRTQADRPDEGVILLWNAETGEVHQRLRGHYRRPVAAAFSPDGRRLATSGWDPFLKLWDPATGQEMLTLRGPVKEGLLSVAFSPDGRRLAAGGVDQAVHIWQAPLPE